MFDVTFNLANTEFEQHFETLEGSPRRKKVHHDFVNINATSAAFEFGEVQHFTDLVDIEHCCRMSICLQTPDSIQLRTCPDEFAV